MDQGDDWHIEGEAGPPPVAIHEEPARGDGESERQRQREARDDKLRRLEVGFAGAVALFALVQAGVSYWQWDVMDRQLRVARDQMEISERPWVSADVSIIGPFVIDADGNAHLTIEVSMRNAGHSVATQVESYWQLFTQPLDPSKIADAIAQQDESCLAASKLLENSRAARRASPAIFPNDTVAKRIEVIAERAAVEAGHTTLSDSERKYIQPMLAGCIVYEFPFGGAAPGEYRALYRISRFTSDRPGAKRMIEAVPGATPVGELRLAVDVFGGHGTAR